MLLVFFLFPWDPIPPEPWDLFPLAPHPPKHFGFFYSPGRSSFPLIPSRSSFPNLGLALHPGDYSPCLNKITSG